MLDNLIKTKYTEFHLVPKPICGDINFVHNQSTLTHSASLQLYVDNKSLYDTANTTHVLADKRLMIDMSALRQMVESKELTMHWISTQWQLADVLTKKGASKQKLVAALSEGRLSFA